MDLVFLHTLSTQDKLTRATLRPSKVRRAVSTVQSFSQCVSPLDRQDAEELSVVGNTESYVIVAKARRSYSSSHPLYPICIYTRIN